MSGNLSFSDLPSPSVVYLFPIIFSRYSSLCIIYLNLSSSLLWNLVWVYEALSCSFDEPSSILVFEFILLFLYTSCILCFSFSTSSASRCKSFSCRFKSFSCLRMSFRLFLSKLFPSPFPSLFSLATLMLALNCVFLSWLRIFYIFFYN